MVFSRKTNLTIHVTTHTGVKRCQCSKCDKFCSTPSTSYWRETISTPPMWEWFWSKWNLKTHLRTHTEEKSHQCSQCDKALTKKTSLTIHLRAHTGDKPFQCSKSDTSFSFKNNNFTSYNSYWGEATSVQQMWGAFIASPPSPSPPDWKSD